MGQDMRLSDFQELAERGVMTFGDIGFRGQCASESQEQITFFNRLRTQYPTSYGKIGLHIRNEGDKHHAQVVTEKAEGMVTGASDIVIPGNPTFVCELKRRDHTLSTLSKEQLDYLRAAKGAGAFVCIALGCDAAWEGFQEWRERYYGGVC